MYKSVPTTQLHAFICWKINMLKVNSGCSDKASKNTWELASCIEALRPKIEICSVS